MLVLTRRANESILIGDDITVTILGVTPGGVRVGVDAPQDKRINRAEIVVAVGDENQKAVRALSDEEAAGALLKAIGTRSSGTEATDAPR
ncbi:MAG: carbon storage regulator CsrA [Naasia sp.]